MRGSFSRMEEGAREAPLHSNEIPKTGLTLVPELKNTAIPIQGSGAKLELPRTGAESIYRQFSIAREMHTLQTLLFSHELEHEETVAASFQDWFTPQRQDYVEARRSSRFVLSGMVNISPIMPGTEDWVLRDQEIKDGLIELAMTFGPGTVVNRAFINRYSANQLTGYDPNASPIRWRLNKPEVNINTWYDSSKQIAKYKELQSMDSFLTSRSMLDAIVHALVMRRQKYPLNPETIYSRASDLPARGKFLPCQPVFWIDSKGIARFERSAVSQGRPGNLAVR